MTDREREQRILESQWHRMNNPIDEMGRPMPTARIEALGRLLESQEPVTASERLDHVSATVGEMLKNFRVNTRKRKAESPKVKKYRNVMNGLIARAGERHE